MEIYAIAKRQENLSFFMCSCTMHIDAYLYPAFLQDESRVLCFCNVCMRTKFTKFIFCWYSTITMMQSNVNVAFMSFVYKYTQLPQLNTYAYESFAIDLIISSPIRT